MIVKVMTSKMIVISPTTMAMMLRNYKHEEPRTYIISHIILSSSCCENFPRNSIKLNTAGRPNILQIS